MKTLASDRLKTSLELATAKDLDALQATLQTLCDRLGADTFGLYQCTRLPSGNVVKQLDNLPPPARDSFKDDALSKAYACPVAAALRLDGSPIYWDRHFYEEHGALPLWLEGYRCAGQSHGVAAQINLDDHTPYRSLTLAFDWTDARPLEKSRLPAILDDLAHYTIAVHAHAATLFARADEPTAPNDAAKVTAREWAALLWSSRGMTDVHTAQILHVSPRTVRKRIDACVEKLGASSRNHAAAIGHRLGYLEGNDTPTVTHYFNTVDLTQQDIIKRQSVSSKPRQRGPGRPAGAEQASADAPHH